MVLIRYAALLLFLLLAGCSSVTTVSPDIPPELSLSQKEKLWQEHQTRLSALEVWGLVGRLGLKMPERSGSMSIEWQQQKRQYIIYLDGPFGQSIAQIKSDGTNVSARVSDEKEVTGPTPEYLMLMLTGWEFPVSSLKYWVRGLPAPDSFADVNLNNLGYPKQIRQQGWQIDYFKYNHLKYKDELLVQMPVRLQASNGDVRMTLVVRSWQLK